MSAFQAAFEALRKTAGDVEADKLLTAVENEGRTDVTAEFVAWLVKRAREHRVKGPQYAKQADVIGRLADRVSRGAVRPDNLLSLPPQGGPEDVPALRARIAELEKQLAEYEVMNPQQCPAGQHADWLVDSEYTHACPWCRIAELEGQADAAALAPGAIEYGTALRATEQAPVEVHSPTASRDEAAARADRYRDMYPVVHLVQRTVHYGEWTEVAS